MQRSGQIHPGDVGNPIVHPDLAAGRAEAGLAGKGDAAVVRTARADVAGVAAIGIAAQDQASDDLTDVEALVWEHLVFQAQVAPGGPGLSEVEG